MSMIKNHNKIKLESDKNKNKTFQTILQKKIYETCPQDDRLTGRQKIA